MAAQSAGRGRKGPAILIALGVAGLLVGVLVWFLAGNRYGDAVAGLAPAPVGCETTLEFDDAGTFTFFLETKGQVGEIEGDCDATDRDYDYQGDALPRVSLTLLDEAGDEIDLDRVSEPSYDADGRAGTAVRTADIEDTGRYILTVEANDPDVVVRVGKDPQRGVGAMRAAGAAVALAGLVAVVLGIVLGRKRQPSATIAATAPYWQPSGGPPPVAPPYAHQPGAPPYAQGPAPGAVWGSPGSSPSTPPPPPPPPPPRRPLPPPPGR
jgi:hypothetical protein